MLAFQPCTGCERPPPPSTPPQDRLTEAASALPTLARCQAGAWCLSDRWRSQGLGKPSVSERDAGRGRHPQTWRSSSHLSPWKRPARNATRHRQRFRLSSSRPLTLPEPEGDCNSSHFSPYPEITLGHIVLVCGYTEPREWSLPWELQTAESNIPP